MTAPARPPAWKWWVCGLLLLATTLLYMDRQTLAQTVENVAQDLGGGFSSAPPPADLSDKGRAEHVRGLGLNNAQYGRLEFGFGIAFALGALAFGAVADAVPVRWLYPLVLVGWSMAGLATGYAPGVGERLLPLLADTTQPPSPFWQQFAKLNQDQLALNDAEQWRAVANFLGLLVCRVVLGVFEAGHWPCALVTTQRMLTRQQLPLGNSILQSGASVGAVLTPFVVLACRTDQPGRWPYPFVAIGLAGLLWVVPWLLLVRKGDLPRPTAVPAPAAATPPVAGFWRKLLVCLVVVVAINLTWQYFRAWNVKFLTAYGYAADAVQYFSVAYYLSADVGCLAVGALVRLLTRAGWDVHPARVLSFAGCCMLTTAGFLVAVLPAGWPLLGLMLCVAAGSLGLFPTYYALTQDLSRSHQGKITGLLSSATWVVSAVMQEGVGEYIERTKQFALAVQMASAAPLVALAVLFLVWPKPRPGVTPR